MAMTVTHIPKVKPNYDPYEADCCGSHLGEVIEIKVGNDVTIRVEQHDSGIGPDWRVTAYRGARPEKLFRPNLTTFVDDDDEFHVLLEA